jgi:ABC-type branched-subunit amino acid transport system substrate-binding protein
MKVMRRIFPFVTITTMIILTFGRLDSASQPEDYGKQLLEEGVAFFNAEKYWDAQQVFEQIRGLPENTNPLLSTASLLLVKTHYRLGEVEQSEALAWKFLTTFPDSRYINEVKITLAEMLLFQGRFPEALNIYLDLLQNSTDPGTLNICKDHLDKVIGVYLDTQTVTALRDTIPGEFARQYLTIKLAEKLHSDGNTSQAFQTLHQLPGKISNRYLNDLRQNTEEELKKGAVARKYIGVILPLTGSNAATGKKLLNGVKYALAKYREKSAVDLAALVLDNRSDPVQSYRQAEFLAKNPRVLAIFGPMVTENATLVAVAANQYQIPMITPTASGSQLAALGPYVFQANLDYENLGRYLGMYSAKIGGVKTVASLSPADEFGREFTDAYCRTIDEYGGQVISQQWYHGEPADLKLQINAMRLTAIDRFLAHFDEKFKLAKKELLNLVTNDPRYRNDSLRIAVGEQHCIVFKPDTTYRLSIPDALIMTGLMKSTDFEVPKRDTVTFPHGLVDGFLIPARADDASLIVPQLTYYDIRGALFGSANWNDPELFRKHRDVLHNLRFISDYYIDTESPVYRQQAGDFKKNIQTEPGRLEWYGYDTMNAILTVIDRNSVTRESIRQGLNVMPVYHGVCRNISFQGNRPRVNSCAFILGFESERLHPVAVIERGVIQEKDKSK